MSAYVTETVDLYKQTVEAYERGDLEDPTADEAHMIETYEDIETL